MESFLPIIQFLLPEFILENFELTSIDWQVTFGRSLCVVAAIY
ncbi:hypothetical protein [Spirosoma pollinicola]|nr:hypothetical protein [Spirosoma pollinicola]